MKYTKKEDKFLRENYLTIPTKRMSVMLGRSESSARQRIKLLGLVIPAEIIQQFKDQTYYKKGSTPENKGKKWCQFMSKEGQKASRKTQFKKGQSVHNHRPVGSERIDSKDGYLLIKTKEPRTWVAKHRVVYEQTKGKILKGRIVVFADGNNRNFNPDNLVLRTRAEHMKVNTYHNYPTEIAKTIQLMGALTRQINKAKKAI